MAGTLTVLKFHTPQGAQQVLDALLSAQKQNLIDVYDAAVVEWEEGKKKPKTNQLNNMAGVGALGGAFWGMLFGLLFFIPLLGLAVGAGIGALTGMFTDVGIDDDFIKQVREKVTPGSSALFLLSGNAVLDKIREQLPTTDFEIIATNLSEEQEGKLREFFAQEDEPASA